MNTIKFCAKCGAPIGPEEKFCGGCGASIAEMEAEAGISSQQAAPAQAPVQQAQPVQQQAPQYDQQYAQPANTTLRQQLLRLQSQILSLSLVNG